MEQYGAMVKIKMENQAAGDSENRSTPEQIDFKEEKIKQISTGNAHSLALSENGEVYAWGLGTNGQIGNGETISQNAPVKVEGLSDIKKVEAYKNISLALSNDGIVYIWGEGRTSLPMKLVLSEKIVDISGNLLLDRYGRIYQTSNFNSPLSELKNIAKISAGTSHNLALDVDGTVYAWGTNSFGECGIEKTGNIEVMAIEFGMYEISAGNGTSILQGEDGKVYVLGNNANGQIGLEGTSKVSNKTEIMLSDNLEIEAISAGHGTHMGLVDKNGFVWHTGTNAFGELGLRK